MKTIIGIDPGAGGGLAFNFDGEVTAHNMPDTLADIRDLLENIEPRDSVIYCERVGTYMPGNSGPSAAKFSEHVGALKGIVCALRIPVHFPTPAQWMHAFIGKPTYPPLPKLPPLTKPKTAEYKEIEKKRKTISAHRKQERKNKIKAKAQQLYPHLKVTLAISDALGILWYAEQQERGMLI